MSFAKINVPINDKINGPLWSVILAFMTFEFLVLVRFNPWNIAKVFRINLPEFHIWWGLLVFQGGFWGYCLYTTVQWWAKLRQQYRVGWVLVIRRLLLFVVIIVSTLFKFHFEFSEPEFRFVSLSGLTVLGFVTAAVAVQGMWVMEAVLFHGSDNAKIPSITDFIYWRDCLDRFLLVASCILGLGIISVATLRNFIWALGKQKEFPNEYVVLFGGLYSILLALAYAPVYLAFQRKGAEITDFLLQELEKNMYPPCFQSIEKWATHKTKLEDILRLRFRNWASLGPGLSILAPLVIAVVSRILAK